MDPVNLMLSWVVARLKEPSSWAGIGLFIHAHMSGALAAWLAAPEVDQQAALLVAAVLAVVMKERQSQVVMTQGGHYEQKEQS